MQGSDLPQDLARSKAEAFAIDGWMEETVVIKGAARSV
jgi:hypothetical protein